MLELKKISGIYSGVAVRESQGGSARFMRLSDLSEIKHGRQPKLATGELPGVARALTIGVGDLIIGARGALTDVCVATDTVLGAFVSLDLYLLRPNRLKVDSQFLATFLELPATQAMFASSKQGSGLARLPKEALEKMEIPVPSMHQQRLIAELAQSFRDEAELLLRLSDLNATFSREVLTRAIRAVTASPNS